MEDDSLVINIKKSINEILQKEIKAYQVAIVLILVIILFYILVNIPRIIGNIIVAIVMILAVAFVLYLCLFADE
ncbi:hypothetical protein KAJ41_00265 [Candidatus Parcubacteria bacterium]|nr:hypothetical protein [Candidatus Parcubacteria bacterium]